MSQLDLLLIHPNGREAYAGLRDLPALEPPLWCAMIASYVRKKGHSVAILDAEVLGASPEIVAREVEEAFDPRLACVVVYGHHPSASTQVMPAAGATCKAIKALQPDRMVMLLGGHVAALPARTYADEACDLVSTGEGFRELDVVLSKIKAGVQCLGPTPSVPTVEDLDGEVGIPAWDLLQSLDNSGKLRKEPREGVVLPTHYRAHNWHAFGGLPRSPYASLYTTLGCPFSCSFCCIQAPFRSADIAKWEASRPSPVHGMRLHGVPSYRRWSPYAVGKALEHLASNGVTNVKIADEMFVLNRAHVEGICDEILRRKLSLNLWAYARTDTVWDGLLPKLRKAGFRWLAFGIEAGDEKVREGSNKALSERQIFDTLRKVREEGIYTIGNFIFGLPGDTEDTMKKTLSYALELCPEFANFYCAQAYPGSLLYTQTLQDRPEVLPKTWEGYSQLGQKAQPLPTETLSSSEVLAFRDKAFRAFFGSPGYQNRILSTFGPETVEEVRRMIAIPLVREASQ